jgi:cysteine-rich repeat protein
VRRSLLISLTLWVAACSFDWASLDPREDAGSSSTASSGSGGSGVGGSGAGGNATSSSTTTSSTGGTGGRGPVCGDGDVGAPEQCDDGNLDPGDGCDELCLVECAGGVVHPSTFHCYVIVLQSSNWSNALDACTDMGAGFDLAAFSSQAEFDWFVALPEYLAVIATKRLWTGGNDQAREDMFVYTNGEPFEPLLWGFGQPDDYMGAGGTPNGVGEDCVEIRSSDDLNDNACGNGAYPLCERPPPPAN